MKRFFALVLLATIACTLRAVELLPIEQQVAEAVQSPKVTIVHFWAPWCSNCKAELAKGGWSGFINENPNVNFIFVTVWRGEQGDGRAVLEQHGVGPQKNFQLLAHPNGSRKRDEKMSSFMGLPVTWIPTTWVFREGTLRYALNYGELRFPILKQLVDDASGAW
jgi:thiol-disulfide isomerase/thioredoxin